jgi:hypothetical protein
LVVALGILAMVLSFAGVIFRVSLDSYRLAAANAEILQKVRVITEQLNADFRGLRKDGEILVFWRAAGTSSPTSVDPNRPFAFERFDTIMFFASGDFYSYAANPALRGDTARICYTLANIPSSTASGFDRPQAQPASQRMLARTQHILLPPPNSMNPDDPLGMGAFDDQRWRDWNSSDESDAISVQGWLLMSDAIKADVLSVIGDVEVAGTYASSQHTVAGGVLLDRTRPALLGALLCEGVGQFKVQGWSDTQQRWIPEVDPDGDGTLRNDSDFYLDRATGNLHPKNIPGLRYPGGPVNLRNQSPQIDQDWRRVPGLGRALKFTFTLYDSRGLTKNGRTFTHVVYLDD